MSRERADAPERGGRLIESPMKTAPKDGPAGTSGGPPAAARAAPPTADEPETIARVIELTERVEAAIAAGDLIEAATLESERRERIAALIEKIGGLAGPDMGVANALSAVLSRTYNMMGSVNHQRRQLLFDASAIRAGRAAAEEYQGVASADGR